MVSELQSAIEDWDGKSVSDLAETYRRNCGEPDCIDEIGRLIKTDSTSSAASWLLKKYLENGRPIREGLVDELFGGLSQLADWESRLHLLQCLPYLSISPKKRTQVEAFLRNCLVDQNKFVRAWAYNGFYILASQYPVYREEMRQFFEMAMRDEAPSVRARIRNLVKNGF